MSTETEKAAEPGADPPRARDGVHLGQGVAGMREGTWTGARANVTRRRQSQRLSRIEQFRARTGGETLAEFFGTFILVLLGDGATATAVVGLSTSGRRMGSFGSADWLIINWGWGLGVCFGVYLAGGVSGAHLNPAVTLAFAWRRDFAWRKVPAYWAAQLLGAFAAGALVFALYHSAIDAFGAAQHTAVHSKDTFAVFATYPSQAFHGSLVGPFIDQVVGTAVLVGLIAALIDQQNQAPESNMSALLVGLVVVVIGIAIGTNAGYAINPARDFGPRLLAWFGGWGSIALPGKGGYFWVPIVGPLVGGPIGILLYDVFVGKVLSARPDDDQGANEAGQVPDAPYTDSR